LQELKAGPALKVWAAESLDRRLRQFRRLAEQFDQLDIAERHQLRIAAKHLRYAGEAYASPYGAKASRYLSNVARLQDGLGAANDVAIAHGLLAELVNRDKKLDHAASLSRGFITGASSSHLKQMERLAARILAARPFWHHARKA
jgi:triphosphatase